MMLKTLRFNASDKPNLYTESFFSHVDLLMDLHTMIAENILTLASFQGNQKQGLSGLLSYPSKSMGRMI